MGLAGLLCGISRAVVFELHYSGRALLRLS